MLGSKFGDYEVVRLIGQGGMGAVYEAVNPHINRRVAIKVLLPDYAKSEDAVRRFHNEARAVNEIRSPGVVQVSDVNQSEDGSLYLVMELLEGETLTSRLQQAQGRLSEEEVVIIAWQLASVLAAAHAKSIVHRGPFYYISPSRNGSSESLTEFLRKPRKNADLAQLLDGSEQGRQLRRIQLPQPAG